MSGKFKKLAAEKQASEPIEPRAAIPQIDPGEYRQPAPAVAVATEPNNRITAKTPAVFDKVKRLKRGKDGVKNTKRYCFEITPELEQQLERVVLQYRLDTGRKITTSAVIRAAIEKYIKE